jgi:hypothetical protein
MPWVATEAWVGDLGPNGEITHARRVAGGAGESVFQPEWSPDGDLYFVSDRGSGWWNLYRERDGAIKPIAPMNAQFGRRQWQFGMSTYAFESADRLICCFVRDGVWTLATIDLGTKRVSRSSRQNSPTSRNFAPLRDGSCSSAGRLIDSFRGEFVHLSDLVLISTEN